MTQKDAICPEVAVNIRNKDVEFCKMTFVLGREGAIHLSV